MVKALAIALAAGCGLGSVSCINGAACDPSDEANPPTRYTDGFVSGGIYQSSSAHGPLLHFPGGARYDLYHHLGYEPIVVSLSWSFSQNGIGTYVQTDTEAQVTGSSALIQLKNDQFVRVKNDACAELWLLVTAYGDSRPVEISNSETRLPEAGAD